LQSRVYASVAQSEILLLCMSSERKTRKRKTTWIKKLSGAATAMPAFIPSIAKAQLLEQKAAVQ
jgi:Phage related protein